MARSKRIAVVINLDWTMKHHQEVFAGIQEYAQGRGWESVLWPFAPKVADERGRRLYDGIIGRVHPKLASRARDAGIPLVNVWISSPCKQVPLVAPDIHQAGRMAAEHLLARGFRRFGFVGYVRNTSTRWLQGGFREVARAQDIPIERLQVSSSFSESARSWSHLHGELRRWIGTLTAPVGVLALTDKLARYTMNAASELGLSVPEEVAVVGLENEELVCLNPAPSITSIDLGWQRVGERAADLLGGLMGRARAVTDPVLLPPLTLIPRRSTDSFTVDDPHVALALRVIAEESHRPIKVRDVVARVPLSWRSLERRFQDCRGTTLSKEITRFRIERAKRLLSETDMLVKQVAEASGFANTRRLCEVFKRTEGISPERYRRQRGA